jgi:hypothetical protein
MASMAVVAGVRAKGGALVSTEERDRLPGTYWKIFPTTTRDFGRPDVCPQVKFWRMQFLERVWKVGSATFMTINNTSEHAADQRIAEG